MRLCVTCLTCLTCLLVLLATYSDFRQVPDNQEVLVRDDSDVSLIVEVLQLARDEGADETLDKALR